MTRPLPLSAQRKKEAEEYRNLTISISDTGLTMAEIRRLEELEQKARNHELEKGFSDSEIEKLAKRREHNARQRIQEGKPPFETTFLSRWRWDGKKYIWTESERRRFEPVDYRPGFSWTPEEISSPHYRLEGTPPGSRL